MCNELGTTQRGKKMFSLPVVVEWTTLVHVIVCCVPSLGGVHFSNIICAWVVGWIAGLVGPIDLSTTAFQLVVRKPNVVV